MDKIKQVSEEFFKQAKEKFGISKEEIEADPKLRESVEKIMGYNKEADAEVDKVMHIIQGMLKDKKNLFSVYLMLAKCINFTSQVFCKDYNEFMEQVQKAHEFANGKLMPVFEAESPNGAFDIRQMLFSASAIVEYLIWCEASGDIQLQQNDIAPMPRPEPQDDNVTKFPRD